MSSQPNTCSAPCKETPQYLHVAIGAALVIFLIFLLHYVSSESTLISLMIFNSIFLLLTFPLNGPLWCKIVWLLSGNAVGILFSLIRLSFSFVLKADFYGVDFFLSNIIDFLWIVPIWSLALSFLGMMKHRKRSTENLK